MPFFNGLSSLMQGYTENGFIESYLILNSWTKLVKFLRIEKYLQNFIAKKNKSNINKSTSWCKIKKPPLIPPLTKKKKLQVVDNN
ncbi:hypothetical protein KL86DYS2_10550 [uncultured Dysgonomonas sp.]|uniref:Uncharacterized protein n=1 Tax=uncultured Dysgonomonas sp. TaxID=206096 RepID=A0A212J242_9BACT|nr:hypothetical protein KL86DYS2_10550 [uncultured Dysgonomonas sp.]